jgi:hypothetical protein
MRTGSVGAVVIAAVLALGACETQEPAGPSTSPGPDFSSAELWLSFDDAATDDGTTVYPDAQGGPHTGRVVVANGGEVAEVPGPQGRGSAVGFPSRCDEPTGCPRAMVEVAPDDALNPGDAAFGFGASVRLAPEQTTAGSNIVQKGRFATQGGQWKLQVDGEDGRPSCLVRGEDGMLLARSSVTVADDAWHRVECRRDDGGISISVDGTVDREDGSTGTLANEEPVRVGSPGVHDDDDQFSGQVDDVFLDVR